MLRAFRLFFFTAPPLSFGRGRLFLVGIFLHRPTKPERDSYFVASAAGSTLSKTLSLRELPQIELTFTLV